MNYQAMLNSFAIFHEVGHAILAINLGIKINYVSILNGDGHIAVDTIFDNEGGIFNLPLIGPWVRKRYLSRSFKYSYEIIESHIKACIHLSQELCQRQNLTYDEILSELELV